MRNILKYSWAILFLLINSIMLAQQEEQINWLNFEDAVALSETEKNPKKIFIDVYTDWCGWCKRMDKDTFQNTQVANYMRDNFYMVKLDAETRKQITFRGRTFNFVKSGRTGYHELAASLLNGNMSYPSVVFLDEHIRNLSVVSGYRRANEFIKIAKYFGDNIYKKEDWKSYHQRTQ